MREYFLLIRSALKDKARKKGKEVYYEAHHIVPRCFNKKSTTVLLTPEEHFLAHMYLAEYWKDHSTYGKKVLWAFHRLSYDGKRKLTKEQYGEVKRLLHPLWKSDKSISHKEKISLAMIGNSNNRSRVFKGMVSDISEEGRRKLSELTTKRQVGKKQWYGGPYTVEMEDGRKYTELSFPDLSKKTGIKTVTLQRRYAENRGKLIRGWMIM